MGDMDTKKSIRTSFLIMIGVGMLFISLIMTAIIGRTVFSMNSRQSEKLIVSLTEKKASVVEK